MSPQNILLWHKKNHFDLKAITKQQKQEKLSPLTPTPFFCLTAGYKFFYWWGHQRDLQTNFAPLVSSHMVIFSVCHHWKPRTSFLCSAISLQVYCSLLKILYNPNFWAIYLSYSFSSTPICYMCDTHVNKHSWCSLVNLSSVIGASVEILREVEEKNFLPCRAKHTHCG